MSKIYYFVPYNLEKNLGKCYNEMMALIPNDEDYGCFVDGDSMFTTHKFGHQIQEVVETYPEVPLFTCVTNRVGTKYQCVDGTYDEERVFRHWEIGLEIAENHYSDCADITNNSPLSGVLMLVRKKEWKEVGGFQEGIGMLGVDNSIHYRMRDAGYKVYMMLGVYVLHYYRNKTNDKSHLL